MCSRMWCAPLAHRHDHSHHSTQHSLTHACLFFFLLLQGLVKDAADFHKKQVKMNTRQLYTQQKYNLFRVRTAQHSTQSSCRQTHMRSASFWATTLTTHCLPPLQEETEGYSKLIAELSELPSAGGADNTSTRGCKSANEVVMNIQSSDRILRFGSESCAGSGVGGVGGGAVERRQQAARLSLQPEFIPHMIGFKFSLYSGRGASAPPESLYNMCGLLLAQGSVSLEAILPHLTPDIKTMADLDEKRASEKRTEARKKGAAAVMRREAAASRA